MNGEIIQKGIDVSYLLSENTKAIARDIAMAICFGLLPENDDVLYASDIGIFEKFYIHHAMHSEHPLTIMSLNEFEKEIGVPVDSFSDLVGRYISSIGSTGNIAPYIDDSSFIVLDRERPNVYFLFNNALALHKTLDYDGFKDNIKSFCISADYRFKKEAIEYINGKLIPKYIVDLFRDRWYLSTGLPLYSQMDSLIKSDSRVRGYYRSKCSILVSLVSGKKCELFYKDGNYDGFIFLPENYI